MLAALLIMALVSPVTSPANEQTLMVRGVDVDECVDVTAGGGGGGPSVWYEQSWDYANEAAMEAAAHAVNEVSGGAVTLLTSGQEGGQSSVAKAMRATYVTTGESTAGLDYLPSNAGTDKPRTVWVEIYIRYNASWSLTSDDKTIFYLEDLNGDEVDRWEIHIGALGASGNPNHWHGGWHNSFGEWTTTTAPNIFDGAWHRLRLYWKMSSAPGQTDGAYKVWSDDTVVTNQTSIDTNTPATGYFKNIAFGRNADPTGSGVRDWGRVRIYISDPRW